MLRALPMASESPENVPTEELGAPSSKLAHALLTQVSTGTAGFTGSADGKIDWSVAYRDHEQGLRKLAAYRMGGEASAIDDVMQEVAIAVLSTESTAEKPKDPQKIGPWLRAVTIHKVQDFWRKVQRRHRLRDRLKIHAPFTAGDAPLSPCDWVLRIENIDAVRDAMGALKIQDRELLEQKYREDITCKELASRHGVAIKTIEYRLKQARAQLRRILHRSPPHSDL
ncbi:MAG: RNA polymerase sigma factor (sigma-70 family) [Verrucomicrobiales bacterium]|jgi:RNA polymerase sigma factor (sigma-70 family)